MVCHSVRCVSLLWSEPPGSDLEASVPAVTPGPTCVSPTPFPAPPAPPASSPFPEHAGTSLPQGRGTCCSCRLGRSLPPAGLCSRAAPAGRPAPASTPAPPAGSSLLGHLASPRSVRHRLARCGSHTRVSWPVFRHLNVRSSRPGCSSVVSVADVAPSTVPGTWQTRSESWSTGRVTEGGGRRAERAGAGNTDAGRDRRAARHGRAWAPRSGTGPGTGPLAPCVAVWTGGGEPCKVYEQGRPCQGRGARGWARMKSYSLSRGSVSSGRLIFKT